MRYRPYRRAAAFILLAAIIACRQSQRPARPGQDARSVVAAARHAYASGLTYRDAGVVRQDFGTATTEKPFMTAFTRGRGLRYEFRSGSERFVIVSSGVETRRWWSTDGETHLLPSLDDAIGEAAGISGGSSAIVPSLLESPTSPSWFERLGAMNVRSHEAVGRTDCVVVAAEDRLQQPVLIWIGVGDHLIRKVTRRRAGVPTTIEYTTLAVNGPVGAAELDAGVTK